MRKDNVMDRHDRSTTIHPESHVDDTTAHRGGGGPSGIYTIGWPCSKPNTLDLNGNDDFLIWEFDAVRFPDGVTIIGFGIITPVAASTYSLSLVKYTSATDASPVIVETIATSGSYAATDDGTIDNPDIASGDLLYVRIPATEVDQLFVRVTFTID